MGLTSATTEAEEAFAVQRLGRSIGEKGGRAMAEAVDMSLGANVQVAIRQIAKELGGVDVLVTAPALYLSKAAERLTDAEWARVVNLNLSAVFFACRGAAREMLAGERGGRIVVILAPVRPETEALGGAAYSAARAGVRGLVEGLAAEWRGRSIAVNCLEVRAGASDAAAARALWLASEEAAGTTGQVLRVPEA